ncbi:hypothetical protein ACJMK2_003331 [Sinanodonta woodiana]|uniref:SH3 domain-containing protein n=1 Tax=Sinanodonta woodiana TaxID=1069815 RepID=A0ABD3Y1K4_SINWO
MKQVRVIRQAGNVPFWLSMMQCRTQLEREFAQKAERWCKNVSDKLHILREHNVDGIIQIESALRMEVAKMEERTRFARESSSSYEEAGKLIITDKDADDKIILHKFETSFQEMLNPYKRFCARVEKEHKVYKRSMVRLEKLYMEENASWFSKRKVRKARKVAKRNSDGYIKLLKEESNQAVNVNSLSVEYEGVAIEIAAKRVKSFVKCWSTCMSHHAEKSSGDARKVITTEQSLLRKVDSEKLVKLLSEFNKESLHVPTYQEFHGTVDVEELLGYRPVVETMISADEHGEEKNELVDDGLLTPADSYDKLYNPFCSNDEIKEGKEEGDKSLTTVNKSDERKLNRCGKAKVIHEHKKMKCLEMNIKPGDLVEQLTPPNSTGMVYGRRRSRITRKKVGGFIPSNCIVPA